MAASSQPEVSAIIEAINNANDSVADKQLASRMRISH